MSKQKNTKIISFSIAAVLIIAALVCWAALRGLKTISVSVTHANGFTVKHDFETGADNLADAMFGYIDLECEETAYGLSIKSVDGEYADSNKGEYWVYTVNGVVGSYRVDTQPISDNGVYAFYIVNY